MERSDAHRDVWGKKVTVVGLGRTSMALVRLLLRHGAKPWVTEQSDSSVSRDHIDFLKTFKVPYELGGHTPAAFTDAAFVIPSPGVAPGIEPIQQAAAAGATVISEMEFAYEYCNSAIIAVTGTNGKTTTTELIRAIIESCGRSVALAGNNDYPFSAAVLEDPAPEFMVLEVSSYQLELTQTFRPWIGALLNVGVDHLGRHQTLQKYAAIKQLIFANQQAGDHAIFNASDRATCPAESVDDRAVWPFSLDSRQAQGVWLDGDTIRHGDEAIGQQSDAQLVGRHNGENVLAALSVARAAALPWEEVLEGLRGFAAVEHRIERVTTIDDVAYYNDSKSTNVDSLKVALETFGCEEDEDTRAPVVLIAGGREKESDYSVLIDLVADRVSTLVTFGEAAPLFEGIFGGRVSTTRASGMDDAVLKAAAVARGGDVVLLSPGCASFDMFANFEERGEEFKRQVFKLAHCRERGAQRLKQQGEGS